MELGLSLGDASNNSLGFLKDNAAAASDLQQDSSNKTGLDFFMSLGLNPGNQERGKAHKSDDEDEDDDDDDVDNDDGSDDGETPVQLNLLPLAPVPRRMSSSHLLSLPWSSDNGSSENGSSEKGLDVNRVPAAEDASTANSVGSPFDFGRNSSNHLQLSGSKRELDGGGEAERGSDDDDNGVNTRKKLRLSKEQSAFLEESFKEHNTLNPKQKLALAKQLNLRPRQVEVWFQNRRARTKLKQTEVDCEYLKRCCDTLSEENRRLHKELQELRALKTSNPYYMHHLPATTLTMCPSCERVATAAPPAVDPTPFPLTRPRFYPFAQAPTHPNQPAPS